MQVVRTPEERSPDLPGSPWRPTGAAGQPSTTVEGASHFVQEDRGEQLAAVLTDRIKGLDL